MGRTSSMAWVVRLGFGLGLATWGCGATTTPTTIPDAGDGGGGDALPRPDAQPDGGADSASSHDDASDAAGDSGTPAPLTAPRSYDVKGTLVLHPGPGNPTLPSTAPLLTRHDFTARIDPDARTLLIGSGGSAVEIPVKSDDRISFATTALVTIPIDVPTGSGLCGNPLAKYDTLGFVLDADALGPRLTGSAAGHLTVTEGDVQWDVPVTLTMTGRPDTEAPSVGSERVGADPLAPLVVVASEPLPAAATARLTAVGVPATDPNAMVTLEPLAPEGAHVVTGFRSAAGQALSYGTSYALTISPWRDLAGTPGPADIKIKTAAPPPMIAPDGFEAGGTVVVGGAAVIDAAYLPPLTGKRSLFLAPDGPFGGATNSGVLWSRRFTARLTVKPADKWLRLKVRPVATADSVSLDTIVVRVAVPGGAITSGGFPRGQVVTLVRQEIPPASGGGSLTLGPVMPFEMALPAARGDELVVDLTVGWVPGLSCGLFPPTPGLLVDDLRLE